MVTRQSAVVGVGVFLFFIIAIGVSTGVVSYATHTVVVESSSGKTLIEQPATDGETVELAYTHSVERTLVTERYEIENQAFRQSAMIFSSFGAGFPSEAAVDRTDDGRFIYEPQAVVLDSLYISSGPIANHELRIGVQTYELYDISDGDAVRVYVVERSTPITVGRNNGNSR